jgi:hypothetical protein
MLILRYPAHDWIVLPVIETIYYWLGARLESYRHVALPVRDTAMNQEN